MALPATGTMISQDTVAIYYGAHPNIQSRLGQLGTNVSISDGQQVRLSASFGG